MQAAVESARRDWAEGHRRLLAEPGDHATREFRLAEVQAIVEELRKHVGSTFTLVELATAYASSEPWVREVVERVEAPRAPTASLVWVADAAFDLFSRGAVDYVP